MFSTKTSQESVHIHDNANEVDTWVIHNHFPTIGMRKWYYQYLNDSAIKLFYDTNPRTWLLLDIINDQPQGKR